MSGPDPNGAPATAERAYAPIACAAYDRLEVAAMRGRPVRLTWAADGGGEVTRETVVADVFARGDAEFVRLADGAELRLDRLRALDGEPIGPAC